MMNVPLFHIHAWGSPFYYVLSAAKIVFPGKFTPESFCELVQNEKVNTTMMVPTMLAMILEYGEIGKWDLSSLTNISIGGGALPLGLKRKAEKLFPVMRAGSGYGMTETFDGVIGANGRAALPPSTYPTRVCLWMSTDRPLSAWPLGRGSPATSTPFRTMWTIRAPGNKRIQSGRVTVLRGSFQAHCSRTLKTER